MSAVESIAAMASTVLEHASKTGVGDRGGERFAVQVVCDIAALAEAIYQCGLAGVTMLPSVR